MFFNGDMLAKFSQRRVWIYFESFKAMKKLLNSLYITQDNIYIKKDGETISIIKDNQSLAKLPIHNIENILIFGYNTVSAHLINFCSENKVVVSFCDPSGRFLARVSGPVHGNVLLRKAQYKFYDEQSFCVNFGKNVLLAKINNCKIVLKRFSRDHFSNENIDKVHEAIGILSDCTRRLQQAQTETESELMGIEGEAARAYFGVFDHMILNQKKDFFLKTRNKRPPTDNVNCMLSYLYTILAHDCRSALECVGLDPAVGFLHKLRPGRGSLALDIMEEFRAYLVDRLVLNLINLKQIKSNLFVKDDTGATQMKEDAKKKLIKSYQERKKETIEHPFLCEKIEIGLLPYIQAMLLARFIRGDYNEYPPFFWC